MSHEIGHDMIDRGEIDPNEVKERIEDIYGAENVKFIADRYAEAYEGAGLTPEEIWVEIICDSYGDMNAFAPVEVLGKINSEFLAKLKGEVKESAKEARGPPNQKNNVMDGVGRASLDKNLGEQLEDWLKHGGKKGGAFNGLHFDLGTTPDVLIKHGAKKVPVIMSVDCVAKVTGMKNDFGHNIAIDEIAKLPSQLNDPILLFKGNYPDSFVALTEIVDKHGHDVVVAIHINKLEKRTKITKIASLYSKTDDYGNNKIVRYVQSQINQGNLIDASIIKAPNWFTIRGLQLPKMVQTILDANNSISQKSKMSTDFREKILEALETLPKTLNFLIFLVRMPRIPPLLERSRSCLTVRSWRICLRALPRPTGTRAYSIATRITSPRSRTTVRR